MGSVHSRVENDEIATRCRESKRLMKQLLTCRSDLAAAHMAYLHSLRNTGATLRQFAESESEVFCNSSSRIALSLPPPPRLLPLPLPPSPPPPQFCKSKKVMAPEEIRSYGADDDEDDNESCISPPRPIHSLNWNIWDPVSFSSGSNSSTPVILKKTDGAISQIVADEDETITEFEDEEEDEREEKYHCDSMDLISLKEKSSSKKLAYENTSMVGRLTKETDEVAMAWRSKKTFAEIMKELDDYFLKAAASGSDLIVLLESTHCQSIESDLKRAKGMTLKSAKVLSWNWSFKSHSNTGACGPNCCESCRPSKHRATLENIYAEEEKLYREVKEDKLLKTQLKKALSSLEKLKKSKNQSLKFEKLRLEVETLQAQILSLQESINSTCLSIYKFRDEELHPQLLEFTLGFLRMWRAMHKCHQLQNHISRFHFGNHSGNEPTTESDHFAAVQLENEVASWHSSFCCLLKALRSYVQVLNQWVGLTDSLPCSSCTSSIKGIHTFCKEWQLALNRLPDKMAADSIKGLISAIHCIVMQQNMELRLEKKSKRLEKRLETELKTCNTTQNRSRGSQPSSNKVKLDALKKRVDDEKAKYLSSIRDSRAMALSNLYTWLPNVFHALIEFSNVCSEAFDYVAKFAEMATES